MYNRARARKQLPVPPSASSPSSGHFGPLLGFCCQGTIQLPDPKSQPAEGSSSQNKQKQQTNKKIFKQQQQKSSKNTAKWWWSWINFYSQAGKLCLSLTKGSEQLNNILNEKVYENTIYGRRSLGPSPILCFSEGVCSGVTAMPFYLSKKSMWPPKAISLENIFFPN